MKRKFLNLAIDSLAFFCFALLCTTGVLMYYILPPGSGHFSQVLGLDRHDWGNLHFIISVIFFSILSVHLILHWRWITGVISGHRLSKYSRLRTLLGLLGVIVILAIALMPLLSPVETNISYNRVPLVKQSDLYIRGSMTLAETENRTGVPAVYILSQLGLPASTPVHAKLGSLKSKYNFEIQEIRVIVDKYHRQKARP